MTYVPKRRREDRYAGWIFKFTHRFFFIIGVAATVSVFFLGLTVERLMNYQPPSLPDKILLTYTFKEGLNETPGRPSLSQPLLRPAATLREVIEALDDAARDDRVKGFVAKLEDADLSLAQVQEIRDAVAGFRKSGKFAMIYSDSFGGFSSGMGDYYMAAAFGDIWLQPVGVVAASGIAMEVPFVKGLLDKFGIATDFAHRGIYKSAPESLTETGMTLPHRAMMESLVADLSDQMIAGIAADRGFAPDKLRALVNAAPFSDTAALREKLVDHLGYYDQVLDNARTKMGDVAAKPVDLLGYAFVSETRRIGKGMPGFVSKFLRKDAPVSTHSGKPKIALIFGTGDIVPYGGASKAGFGESGMAADKIIAAFQSAQQDSDVAAIVFRIDSPGGEPSASESIRRAILQVRAKGKPVVVSMSGTAASGAYWVASGADKIVAQPATLTGSIGVFGGKFVMAGLWEKLGVNWQGVAAGDRALMWSSNTSFTPEERQKFNAMLGDIYDAFLARVMEGRKMTREQAEAVAEGRVWTGRQAKDKRLVDDLGGLDRAVAIAKAEAKLDPASDVPVVNFPPRKSTLEMFISLATGGTLFRPDITVSLSGLTEGLHAADDGLLKAGTLHLR